MMMHILIVGLLLNHEAIAQTPEGLRIPFTQKFRELRAYMQGTEAWARIYRKVSSVEYTYNFRPEDKECPQRLLHIIKENMKCTKVAEKLEPQLFSMHLWYAMMENEKLWEGIGINRNCSRLSGEDHKMCEKSLIFLSKFGTINDFTSDLNQEVNNCYLEERGNQTNFFTKRYVWLLVDCCHVTRIIFRQWREQDIWKSLDGCGIYHIRQTEKRSG